MGRAGGGEGDYGIYTYSSSTPDGRSRGEVGSQEGGWGCHTPLVLFSGCSDRRLTALTSVVDNRMGNLTWDWMKIEEVGGHNVPNC